MEHLITLLIAFIPAGISGLVSWLVARNNTRNEIDKIDKNYKYEIDKLLQQHQAEIDALKLKQEFELERIEKDHQYQKELIELRSKAETDSEIKKQDNNIQNQILSGLFGELFNNPDVQGYVSDTFKQSLEKNN